jgi:threonine/homoserine/homoserine lactone efflux protein
VGRVGPTVADALEDHARDPNPIACPPVAAHNQVVPDLAQLTAFLVASILFIQVPGPSLLFTIGRALTVGRADALWSVVGNALGLFVQVLGVTLGLGALVAASAAAFTVLKLVGAVYVVWLGVQAIRHRADARAAMLSARGGARRTSAGMSVRTGFVVGATNPKTIVFFAAFLPQFLNESAPAAPQLLVLGVVFSVMAVASDSVWVLVASRARDWFASKPERLDRMGAAGGVMMIGLGATLATTGSASH